MGDARRGSRFVTLGFGAGSLGSSLSYGAVPLLFLFYLTEFARVPPATAGVLLAIPKLADLFLDPWIGRRSDALARSLGSRSGILTLGAIAQAVLLLLLFVPMLGLPLPLRVGLLGLFLVALSLMSTVYTVAHTAIASDIADGIEGRSTLMSSRAIGQTIAGLLVSVLAPQLVAVFGAFQGGYLGMAAVLAAVALVAQALCWTAVRRVPLSMGVESEAAPPLMYAVRKTLRNKAFYCIALILILMGASSTALLSALPYANKHLLHAGAENLSVLLSPLFVSVLLGVAVAPWLARHVRPGPLMAGAMLLALGGIAWIAFGARVNASIVVGCSLFGLALGVLTVMVSTLAIEASTKSSTRGESLGLYLGILFSAEKLGQSLGGIVVGFGLDWVGPLEPGVHPLSLDRLEILWVGAPALGLVAALFVLMPLTSRLRALPVTGH